MTYLFIRFKDPLENCLTMRPTPTPFLWGLVKRLSLTSSFHGWWLNHFWHVKQWSILNSPLKIPQWFAYHFHHSGNISGIWKPKKGMHTVFTKYMLNSSRFPTINITDDLRETNQTRVFGEALILNSQPQSASLPAYGRWFAFKSCFHGENVMGSPSYLLLRRYI